MNRMWVRLSIFYGVSFFVILTAVGVIMWGLFDPGNLKESVLSTLPEDDLAAIQYLIDSGTLERTLRIIARGPVGFLMLLAFVASIASSVWASWWITRPLTRLGTAADKIGAGDTSYRVQVEGTCEIVGLAQSFNAMAEALESSEKQRQNMLADISHELRTPLTVLQGNLRGMLDDVYALDKLQTAKLYEQTRHLHHLVNDLHDLAQAEARRLQFDMKGVDLSQLVQQVVELYQPLAMEAGTTLVANVPARVPFVRTDQRRFMQVMQNLVSNSLRYAKSHIALSLVQQENELILTISDDGIGIDPEHLPYIFDRFYHIESSSEDDTHGTGLGLAIAKSIVEALDGTIAVESVVNEGTTFTIAMPVNPRDSI